MKYSKNIYNRAY